MNTVTQITQDNWEADLTGSLLDMPFKAGRLRFALGADYRSDNFNFNPDSGFNANQDAPIVLQNIILPVGVQGETHVSEVYGELAIPLLKDKPFAKSPRDRPRLSLFEIQHGGGREHLQTPRRLVGHRLDQVPWRTAGGQPRAEYRGAVHAGGQLADHGHQRHDHARPVRLLLPLRRAGAMCRRIRIAITCRRCAST